jgi:hypothetical protein
MVDKGPPFPRNNSDFCVVSASRKKPTVYIRFCTALLKGAVHILIEAFNYAR